MDTTVSDPLVGQLLDGRYHVGPRLARGGMATVYEAHDNRLDRTIALKVMHPSLADDEEFVSRFIREAHSAARLSHPNVVAVYDQGADQGHVFLAMELVRGRTLRDLIRESGHLSPRQALEVLEPMLAALGAAHQAGLIHRDVKPENVLLSDDDRVKVADFGLARAVSGATSHTTASGVLMGTVAYLSPEQVTRGVADPRSDVYAVGILLYEMLTGRKPYDGETAIQVAYRHVHDDVPPPSALVPGLPAELDQLVARATSRDPDGRPADARRFLSEVVTARRAMSDGELDTLGPALAALSSQPDHTLVVDLTTRTSTPARRGDTGPLAHTGHGTRVRGRRSRGPIALLVVVALAVALSGIAWFVAEGPLSKTTTPGLLNLTAAQAKDKAALSGLEATVKGNGFSEVVPVGRVLETDPARGEDIDKGGTVALILSKGPERYAVPNVVGRTEEVARSMIEDGHLTVATPKRKYSSKVDKGKVISSDPPAGEQLKRDEVVQLVISDGPEPVAVPNVVGMPVDQAKVAVTEAELRPEVTEKFHETVPAGIVIRQSPERGTADKDSVLELVVSKGPPLVEVPDLVGANVADAQNALAALGLVASVQQIPAGPGTVRSQSPGDGDKIPKGSTVTLYVF